MTEYETITDPNEPMRVGDLVVERVDAVDPARGSFDGTRVRLERPMPAPGTTGTATVRGVPGVRVIRTEIDPTPGLIRTQWASGVMVMGERMHTGSEVTDFVPDADAERLKAELDASEAKRGLQGDTIEKQKRRADRVRAVLAENGPNVSCAGHSITADGCFVAELAKRVNDALDGEQKYDAKPSPEPDQGLQGRYRVERIGDTTGKHAGCRYFVLDPRHDPIAVYAIRAYAGIAQETGHQELAEDLFAWVGPFDSEMVTLARDEEGA